jgi:hypothetical protein
VGTPVEVSAAISGWEHLQPWRHRVGWRAEYDADATAVSAVEHGLQPVEVELAVARLPRRPDRFTHPNYREAGLLHQIEVELEAIARGILRVVRGAKQHAREARGCSHQ